MLDAHKKLWITCTVTPREHQAIALDKRAAETTSLAEAQALAAAADRLHGPQKRGRTLSLPFCRN